MHKLLRNTTYIFGQNLKFNYRPVLFSQINIKENSLKVTEIQSLMVTSLCTLPTYYTSRHTGIYFTSVGIYLSFKCF